jgi:hypothetical protein
VIHCHQPGMDMIQHCLIARGSRSRAYDTAYLTDIDCAIHLSVVRKTTS